MGKKRPCQCVSIVRYVEHTFSIWESGSSA